MKQCGTEICKQLKLSSKSQQRLFGTVVAAQVVPLGSAHRAQQHRVGRLARVNRVLRKRTAHGVDCNAAREFFGKIKFVTVNLAHAVKSFYRLVDYIRTYSVAGYRDNVVFHFSESSFIFRNLFVFLFA